MSRRLISRISRWRRNQSPKELDSFCTASFSQGGWRLLRLMLAPPAPDRLSGPVAGSVSRVETLFRLGTIFGTRLTTLRGSSPGVKFIHVNLETAPERGAQGSL